MYGDNPMIAGETPPGCNALHMTGRNDLSSRPDPMPQPVVLEPYPQPGDKEGWERWWQSWRDAFRAARARSADGINAPPPLADDSTSRRRQARRRRLRRIVESVVRDLLVAELPEAVALLLRRDRA
jgi:hypothetical protein